MLAFIETFWRRLRRGLSRSVWLSRLLRLPVSEGSRTRPGLVLIQVDGLSQPQLEQALERGEMPFLQRLLRREHYAVHAHYSGLPSTTPAVQAELFYGRKGSVPAFSFRERESRQVVRMYETDAATRIEAQHEAEGGQPLLEGGSAYADNFTGGAAESHFCPSSMGWGPMLRAANPVVMGAFLLANLYSFLRVGALMVMEFGLALYDFFRGVNGGQDFFKELKFIPTRVAISILLRELCVIGGKIDISRGLPIIHMNFLGYDEQSHRRGPGSLFAHWTLKGIDDAIARLWRAANRAERRHYEVWIYSDHGQLHVQPYGQLRGYSLEAAVEKALEKIGAKGHRVRPKDAGGIQTQRVALLGGEKSQRLFPRVGVSLELEEDVHPVVAALGPVGHIYFPQHLAGADRETVARELVHAHGVPAVLKVTAPGRVRAYTSDGEFELPEERAALLGTEHPFLDAAGAELATLCEHPDAGELVALGWRNGVSPLTFAEETGAHAGASPEETNGFALLPRDAPLPVRDRDYLRPLDLREAALRHLGRTDHDPRRRAARRPSAEKSVLRVMTYNVHSCVGMDGKLDAERIARVIARARPDVVALQELDVGRARTGSMDQAHRIAHHLEMEFHFHPALHLEEERYGDAILTHLPMRLVKAGALPGLPDKPRLEPRGALWVAVELDGREIQVLNTHLGLSRRERLAQIDALVGPEWLGHRQCHAPLVFCGDLNALPSSPVCSRLKDRLADAQELAPTHRPRSTFSSRMPNLRIDHVFVSAGVDVGRIEVPDSELARVASDHLPLVAELRFGDS